MPRLIDADAIDFTFPLPDNLEGMLKQIGIEMAKIRVSLAPTIEAEPVRHGEWRIFRDECVLLAECSECGTVQSGIAAAQWDYCPMCGCRMDGGADDGA